VLSNKKILGVETSDECEEDIDNSDEAISEDMYH
jgi:hypothetical protein